MAKYRKNDDGTYTYEGFEVLILLRCLELISFGMFLNSLFVLSKDSEQSFICQEGKASIKRLFEGWAYLLPGLFVEFLLGLFCLSPDFILEPFFQFLMISRSFSSSLCNTT